jgi:protein ImuB
MFACIYCPKGSADFSLADFGYSFSPLVEETAPDCVVLDVAGCELRFGSAYQLANEIADFARRPRTTGGLNQRVNIALAGNPDTAILAARFFEGITFVAPGEELTALGDLPIEKLFSLKFQVSSLKSSASRLKPYSWDLGLETWDEKLFEELLETFRLWGVRTLRDFAKLPTVGVAERLGQTGVRLQQLAAGKTERHLQLKQSAPIFNKGIELEYPLAELEPLSFIFARLLNQLCASLLAYALATNELRVQLKLEDGTSHDRTLSLPTPLRDHKIFLKLLLLDTELHPPQQGVVGITIACDPVKPRVLQSGLFIPQAPEPAKLELTLARLAKLVGGKNVGSAEVLDTHRPDAFQIKRFVLTTERKTRKRRDPETRERGETETRGRGDAMMRDIPHADTSRADVSHPYNMSLITPSPRHPIPASPRPRLSSSPPPPVSLGFRMFRPPLRAIVDASRGYPQRVSAWGPNRSVYGKVVQLAGPWRRTGDWWRDDCWARDEWDVAVEQTGLTTGEKKVSQALYRIYRELRSGAWFVEGTYD